MIQTKKRKMPEVSVAAAKPVNDCVKSSLMLPMHDLVGTPLEMDWDQLNWAGVQMPAQVYSSSKNSIHSIIVLKSSCSRNFFAKILKAAPETLMLETSSAFRMHSLYVSNAPSKFHFLQGRSRPSRVVILVH